MHPDVILLFFLGLYGMSLKNWKKEQNKEMEREREYRIGRNLKEIMEKGEEIKNS